MRLGLSGKVLCSGRDQNGLNGVRISSCQLKDAFANDQLC